MKKNKKKVIIFILTLAPSLLILFFLDYRRISAEQMFIANGLYSDWSIEISESLENKDFFLEQGGRIFIEHTLNGNVRTIKSPYNWSPPLIQGEFFTEKNPYPVAVVGQRKLPEEGNFFEFEGQMFEIIGILGAGFPSALDNIALLSPNSFDFTTERIVLDANSRQMVETLALGLDYRLATSQQERLEFSTQLGVGRDLFEEMMGINTFFITLILLTISSHAFLVMTEKNNEILYLQGQTYKRILIGNHRFLTYVFLTVFLVTVGIDVIQGSFIVFHHLNLYIILFFLQQFLYAMNYMLKDLKRRVAHVL